MRDEAVNRCFLYLILFLIRLCDRVVSEDPSLIVYCLNKYKTERIFVMKFLMVLLQQSNLF